MAELTKCCWGQTLVLLTRLLTDAAERRQPLPAAKEKGKQSPSAKLLQKVTSVSNISFALCKCKSESFM